MPNYIFGGMPMFYVGIDISKYKHECYALGDFGEVIYDNFSFSNDAEGFSELLLVLSGCEKECTRIGFEATAHYALNLKLFLEKNGYSFMELNPVLVSKFTKSQTLRKTKTDKLDARIIAQYLEQVDYKPYPTSFYHNYSLKSLTRLRDALVRQRSVYLVRLTNVMDCIFPEFKPFFGNRFSLTALYILENYGSPETISKMNSRSFDILRRKSRGSFTMEKFVRLKQLAVNTVGETNTIYALELKTILDLYNQLDSKVCDLENEITRIITDINPPSLSIKGIGPLSAAILVSEFGDFNRFSSPDKMLSFAGLEPGYFQSGNSAYAGRMVKRGSGILRYTIINCCRSMRLHNEVFSAYYFKKVDEGKPHRVALSHMAKKLVRLIFALETTGAVYDPAKQR